MITISAKTARHVVLHLQGLTRPHHKAFARGELETLIEQLGFVQLDSIRWMERAHHMTLAARSQSYRPQDLENLHESGFLFENWTHDASLIPSQFWVYWKHKFARNENRMREKFTRWQGEGFEQRVQGLSERIDTQGVLRSRDLEKPKDKKLEMWQWHDGKAALEFMWRTGQLAIPRREGFQKIYDFSHRVIPEGEFSKSCIHDEFVDWACRSALDRLGFGTAKDIAAFWDLLSLAEVKTWLDERAMQETKSILIVGAKDGKEREFFARPDIEYVCNTLPKLPERIRILSPFDPAMRDRKRLKWLFDFDYTIEIYVPPKKRKYGYYVFPLLEKDRVIGRIDCQAQRAQNAINVKRVWLEPKVKWSNVKEEKLRSELARQARLCNVSDVQFEENWLVTH